MSCSLCVASQPAHRRGALVQQSCAPSPATGRIGQEYDDGAESAANQAKQAGTQPAGAASLT
jgi:hypothetical protein